MNDAVGRVGLSRHGVGIPAVRVHRAGKLPRGLELSKGGAVRCSVSLTVKANEEDRPTVPAGGAPETVGVTSSSWL
jgi:hypothetical protein